MNDSVITNLIAVRNVTFRTAVTHLSMNPKEIKKKKNSIQVTLAYLREKVLERTRSTKWTFCYKAAYRLASFSFAALVGHDCTQV